MNCNNSIFTVILDIFIVFVEKHILLLTIMDITKLNFIEQFPSIKSAIEKSDFFAFDTELSGLTRDKNWHIFDTPAERFAKIVVRSRGYFILQFGLSCFTSLSEPLKYSVQTYNFYIFPQANKINEDSDRTLSLQTSAIQFLSEHNFDFNKLFRDGLSYLSHEEFTKLKENLKSKANVKYDYDSLYGLPTFVPTEFRRFMKNALDDIKKNLEKFLEAKKNGCGDSISTEISSFTLKCCTNRQKRTVMKQLIEAQPWFEYVEVEEDFYKLGNDLIIHFFDKDAKEQKQVDELILTRGFFEVISLIMKSKKPIVGHNPIMDLIQTINQFVAPITPSYREFKIYCQSLFPVIYDTKFLCHETFNQEMLSNNLSRLEDLYEFTKNNERFPRITIENLDTFKSLKEQAPHQAGYDSFMCGYAFITLCESWLETKQKHKQLKEDPDSKSHSIASNQMVIDRFANQINLPFTYDYKSFNLGTDEPKPQRDHLFYVEHPETWQTQDLFSLFKPYGGVKCGSVTSKSTLCILRNPSSVSDVHRAMNQTSSLTYKIHSYQYYLDHILKIG